MNKHSEIRLYNVLFPFWMLLLFPHLWLIVLPGNFFIDSLVLLVSLIVLRVEGKKEWYKKHIIPVYAFGMLADMIGSVYMLFLMIVFEVGRMGDEWYLTIPALVLSAGLIFVFNFFHHIPENGAEAPHPVVPHFCHCNGTLYVPGSVQLAVLSVCRNFSVDCHSFFFCVSHQSRTAVRLSSLT